MSESQTYGYYPGCSLKGTGRAYEESLLAVFEALDIPLQEVDDWNCCGATAYMAVDESRAFVLAARNLALAEREGRPLCVPCSACYLVLEKTKRYIQDSPHVRRTVESALKRVDLEYRGTTVIRHPLDILAHDIGPETIARKVTRPLDGLRVAPYYGCQVVRPFSTFDHQSDPVTMDRLLEALGAEVVTYPLKTRCCGGSLTGTMPEAGLWLCYILLKEAEKRGAQLIATLCPLCQFNLDAYQDKIGRRHGPVSMPTVYFTQLIGLAFGLPAERLGLTRNIVPAEPVLSRQAVAAAAG